MTSIPRRWNLVAIWFFGTVLAVLSCSLNWSAATIDGHYIPVGNDSFYHARRILDTAQDPASFYQFDQRIHAPEGSLLVWPWGYDYGMASLVRLAVSMGISTDPIGILVWLPVAAVALTIALIVLIGRGIGLSNWPIALGVLCMALAPTTQLLHGTGQVDHHFAELIFLLAALASGLWWLHKPERIPRALLVATVLGVAPAIHNGLFITQVPLLATAFVFWLQDRRPPARASAAFAAMLLLATLAVLLPSLPFRLGKFEFFTLSWFHFYVAACTASAMVLMSHLRATRGGVAAFLAIGVALLLPILNEIRLAQSFLGGTIAYLSGIAEMQSPIKFALDKGAFVVNRFYSYLIWAAPLTVVLCVVQGWRDRASARLLFWLTSLMGLILLTMQLRLHYFGSFALYLPWLAALSDFLLKRPPIYKKSLLIVSLLLLLMYAPVLRYQLGGPMARSNDASFERIYPLLQTLRDSCRKEPGIVLADGDAGHYIRYFTECSVIANNFLLTPQQIEKFDEMEHLFSLSPAQLLRETPQVRYVLIRPQTMTPQPNGTLRYTFFTKATRLANTLLMSPATSVPSDYKMLGAIDYRDDKNVPYAKLYRIDQQRLPQATSSIDVIK